MEKKPEEIGTTTAYKEAETFQRVQHFDIRAARDLRYSDEIITALKQATTIAELNRIMARGRKQKFG